MIKYTYRKTVD